jgi:hypothetical protein
MIIASSWLLFHRWWLSLPVAAAIALWWWYFLLVYPRLVRQAIAMELDHSSNSQAKSN